MEKKKRDETTTAMYIIVAGIVVTWVGDAFVGAGYMEEGYIFDILPFSDILFAIGLILWLIGFPLLLWGVSRLYRVALGREKGKISYKK